MPTLRKIAAQDAVSEGLRCSFCGKPRDETRNVVAGQNVCICEECVSLAAQALKRP